MTYEAFYHWMCGYLCRIEEVDNDDGRMVTIGSMLDHVASHYENKKTMELK